MDCSLPGSSVCGILQAQIPEWVAMLSFRRATWRLPGNLLNPGIEPRSPALKVDSLLSESPKKAVITWRVLENTVSGFHVQKFWFNFLGFNLLWVLTTPRASNCSQDWELLNYIDQTQYVPRSDYNIKSRNGLLCKKKKKISRFS